jgi:tetratricopeptide (TPR) repeat protein
MNSWHSWTPDGKWLVFTSKAHSDYTQLYLTRMGADGTASPPVWLAHMVDPGRAANIPEFVDLPPDYIVKIKEQFLDDYSYTRAGNEFFRAGDADNAIAKFQTALSMNPNNAMAHQRLGFLLYRAKHQPAEAVQHTQTAIRLEPRNPFAQFDLGFALFERKDFSNAVPHLAEAARLLPKGFDRVYNATDINYLLGEANYRLERFGEAVPPLLEVIARTTNHARANFLVAMSKAWLGETDTSNEFYKRAIAAQPEMARLPDYYDLLSRNYLNNGDKANALVFAEKAHSLALAAGRTDQAARLQQRLEYCRSNK